MRGHLSVLDALRGGCAIWVVAAHASGNSGYFGHWTILDRGDVAVNVFMFLSGFLMTYHYRLREYAEPWESPQTWRKFYVRRFFRIAPLYYLALIIALVFRPSFTAGIRCIITAFPHPLSTWLADSPILQAPSWPNILAHFTFLYGFIPAYCASNILPDWSIGLEMQFYLFFPFIMLAYRQKGHLIATALLLGLWSLSHQLFAVYTTSAPKLFGLFSQPAFLPLSLDCFVVGILMAEAVAFRRIEPLKSTLLVMLAAVVALTASADVYFWVPVLGCSALMLVHGMPLGRAKLASTMERMLRWKVFSYLADVSYGSYLLHMPILPVDCLLIRYSSYPHWRAAPRFLILFVIVLIITQLAAFAAHKLIEQPGLNFGRNLLKHWPAEK
jgi:peptidoglycan/LPS O-acetylase OafA/YrhL